MAYEGIKAKPGTGTDPEFPFDAADDGSGTTRKFPRMKLVVGGEGTATPVVPGQATKSSSLPFTLASDQESLTRCNGSIAVAAISVGTTATKLGTGASGAPLANRKRIRVQNLGSVVVYLGPSGVTSSSGLRLAAGGNDEIELGPGVDLYGRTASGTADVRVMEFA